MGHLPSTLGELKRSEWTEQRFAQRTVKDELRDNLLARLADNQPLFPGIHGYDDTVVPQIVNAILSKHNFILLGLRGQAKSRILRALTDLLDAQIPVLAACEINDHPYRPICRQCRATIREQGDAAPIRWLPRDLRFVEKLATPDVTIADIIGDIDPIKAARGGRDLSDELTVHYGLLPRSNRGIFAINELPDLAGKIQVGLFNIMQEGDIQIKGYPIRLPLDLLLVFTANPEDYTARGKIVTPLKDRIGSEIRTHYPLTLEEALAITSQEAWVSRNGHWKVEVPTHIREIIEQIAFLAREDKRVDRRSGVSQRLPITCLESAVSSAERRAARNREPLALVRVVDVYAALPSLTGKLELEYEGELRGAENVARELIRTAVGKVFSKYFSDVNLQPVVQWFELGGELKLDESAVLSQALLQFQRIQGLTQHRGRLDFKNSSQQAAQVSAAEFILEGLWAQKRISRSEERGYFSEAPRTATLPAQPEPVVGPRAPRRRFNN
jgi:magnesium chelatase subunit I